MKKLFVFVFILVLFSYSSFAFYDSASNVLQSGVPVNGGDLNIRVYDASSGGTQLCQETFDGEINNGFWSVLVSNCDDYLFRGLTYYKEYRVNGNLIQFGGSNRLAFVSSRGSIGITYSSGTINIESDTQIDGDLDVTGSITGDISATQITSDILDVSRIPSLPASRITTGEFPYSRLPISATDVSNWNNERGSQIAGTGLTWSSGNLNVGGLSHSEVAFANQNLRTSDSVTFNQVTANAFFYSSDERLKENIMPLKSSLAKIESLQGVSFDWRDTGKASIGFIAQDVQQVLPEIISIQDSKDSTLSVDYASIVPLLVEAIKEQQSQILELERKVLLLKD